MLTARLIERLVNLGHEYVHDAAADLAALGAGAGEHAPTELAVQQPEFLFADSVVHLLGLWRLPDADHLPVDALNHIFPNHAVPGFPVYVFPDIDPQTLR